MPVTGTHQFATGISTGYQQGGPIPDDEDDTVDPTAPAAAPAIPSGYAAAAPMVQPPAPSASASDADAGEEDQEQSPQQQPQQPRAKAPAKMRAPKMKKVRGGKRGRRRVTGFQQGGEVGDQSNYSNYAGLMSARAAPSVWADGGYVRGYQIGGPVTDDETDPNYYPGQDVAYSPQDNQPDQPDQGFRDTAGTGASRAEIRRRREEQPPADDTSQQPGLLQRAAQALDLSNYLQPQRGAGSTDEAGFQQTDFSDADHVRNVHQNLLDWYSSPDHPSGLQGMLQGDDAMHPDEMSARLNAYSDANPDHGHNEAIQGSIADAMRNGDIAGAAGMLQNARQSYDGMRAIGTHALEDNNSEGVKAAVEAAHNHVPDDTKLTVTPQQDGNSYNFHVRDSNGQAATYNLSPDQVWQYTHGLAGQFDHVMSNGVHQNLQTLTQQGAPAAAQTGYAAAAPTGPGTVQTKTPSGVPLGIPLVRDQAGQVVGARTTEGAPAQRVLPQGQQAQPQFTREEMESGVAQREEGAGQQGPYGQTYAYPNYQPTPKGGVGAGFVQRMPGANAEAYELLGPGGERAPTGDIRSPRQKALDDYKNQLRAETGTTRPLPQLDQAQPVTNYGRYGIVGPRLTGPTPDIKYYGRGGDPSEIDRQANTALQNKPLPVNQAQWTGFGPTAPFAGPGGLVGIPRDVTTPLTQKELDIASQQTAADMPGIARDQELLANVPKGFFDTPQGRAALNRYNEMTAIGTSVGHEAGTLGQDLLQLAQKRPGTGQVGFRAPRTEQESADLEMQMAKRGYTADEYRAALRQGGVDTRTEIPYQPANVGYAGAQAIPPSELKSYNPQTGNYDRPVTDQVQLARQTDEQAAARRAATSQQIAPAGALVPSDLTGKARAEAMKGDVDRYKAETAAAAPPKGKAAAPGATEAQIITAYNNSMLHYQRALQDDPKTADKFKPSQDLVDEYNDIMRARRAQRQPTASAAPAQTTAPAGGRAPVRVNSPAEARNLPSGTPIILPDGSQRYVP